MKILSYHNIRVPGVRGRALNVVRSCAELSRRVPVTLAASRGSSRLSFREVYGFEPEAYPDLTLRLSPYRQGLLSGLWRRRAAEEWLARNAGPGAVVRVTEARSLKHFARLRSLGELDFRLVLECAGGDHFNGADLGHVDAVVYTSATVRREQEGRHRELTGKPGHVSVRRLEALPERRAPGKGERRGGRNGFVLCYVGSIASWQGLETLVDAAALLPERFHVLIVGGRRGGRYRESLTARAAGLGGRVRFSGFLPASELGAVLGQADAFVLPLASESAGATAGRVTDYLSWGLPVLAAETESVRELLEDGESGVLFEPGSAESLAAGARRLASMSEEARGGMVSAGREVLRSRGADRWAEEMVSWLGEVLGA
jgi:glycosyltransferase involved in cell wall biosynthesis